jgi:hypothetical protein
MGSRFDHSDLLSGNVLFNNEGIGTPFVFSSVYNLSLDRSRNEKKRKGDRQIMLDSVKLKV